MSDDKDYQPLCHLSILLFSYDGPIKRHYHATTWQLLGGSLYSK